MSTSGSQPSTITFPHKPHRIPSLASNLSIMLLFTYTNICKAQNTRANNSVLNLDLLFTIIIIVLKSQYLKC